MLGNIEIEYTITVKNEGQVEGTVRGIVDYIDYNNNAIAYRPDGQFINPPIHPGKTKNSQTG